MHLLMDGIRQTSDEIEILLYVRHDEDASDERARFIEAILTAIWGGTYRVTLCHSEPRVANRDSLWQYYVKPVTNFLFLEDYAQLTGSAQIAALEQCLTRHPEYLFVLRLKCMPPILLTKEKLPPVFMDLDDIEHLTLLRNIRQPPRWPGKWLQYLWVLALMKGEKTSMKLAEKTFVCSEVDRSKLQKRFRLTNIEVIPNAIAAQKHVALTSAPSLLLLGQYNYLPNQIGAEFFLDEVWPIINASVPLAHLTIAGPNSQKIRHAEHPPAGVHFPGYVDDLDALYADTRVVVCPILSGGGTRVKIMEAAAYGKPVVTTTIGAEGIDLHNDKSILLRDEPNAFALACIALLQDQDLASRIGGCARQVISEKYERFKVISQLADHLRSTPTTRLDGQTGC